MRLKIDGWYETALILLANEQDTTTTQIVKQLITEALEAKGKDHDNTNSN